MFQSKTKFPRIILVSFTGVLLAVVIFVLMLFSIDISSANNGVNYRKDDVLALTNFERIKNDLNPLQVNKDLEVAAQAKADHMASGSYFSHVDEVSGKKWSDFIKESGYKYSEAGENLANGFWNANVMVEMWMDSPTHKENILNTGVDETGFGISVGEYRGVNTIFVVQMFGSQ